MKTISTTGTLSVNSGNPFLKPFRAKTFDLSAEWYHSRSGFIGLGLFQKNIDTYIQILRQDLPYTDLTALNPSAFAPTFCTGVCSGSTIFQLTSAVNTEGGPLEGFEVSYQQPFSFLPGGFRHFGVLLNYTHVKSDIDYAVPGSFPVTYIADELVNLGIGPELAVHEQTEIQRALAAFEAGEFQMVVDGTLYRSHAELSLTDSSHAVFLRLRPLVGG